MWARDPLLAVATILVTMAHNRLQLSRYSTSVTRPLGKDARGPDPHLTLGLLAGASR